MGQHFGELCVNPGLTSGGYYEGYLTLTLG